MGRIDTNSNHHLRFDQSRVQSGTRPVNYLLSLATILALSGGVGLAPVNAQMQSPSPQRSGAGLQLNDSGDSVLDLQRQLADLGYYTGEITGFFGSQTQEAVMRFQQNQGLAADGVVGPATAQSLYQGDTESEGDRSASSNSIAPQSAIQLNDANDQVAELQRRLAQLGYFNGEASGVFDYSTEAAVMQFQRDQGLTADGVVGTSTEAALRRPTEEINRSASSSSGAGNNLDNGLLRLGSTGQSVNDLQLRLRELGFYQGEVTGTYGPETEAAVIAFQEAQGLTADGIVGPEVNTSLNNFGTADPTNRIGSDSASGAGVDANGSGTIPENSAINSASTSTGASNAGLTPSTGGTASTTATPAQPGSPEQLEQARLQAEQARLQAEQAQLQAEQARLQAEQAQIVLFQNLEEGKYSIAALQQHLRRQGYYPGEVNGMLTTETQTAIVEAQRQYGLSQTDLFITSPETQSFVENNNLGSVEVNNLETNNLFPY